MRLTLTKKAVEALNQIANHLQMGISTPNELIVNMAERLLGQSANLPINQMPPQSAPKPKEERAYNRMLDEVAPKPKVDTYSRFTDKDEAYLVEQAKYYIKKGDFTTEGQRINEDICIAMDELDSWDIDLSTLQSELDPANYPPKTATGGIL